MSGKRGRKSIAENIMEGMEDEEESGFLVLYDFASKPPQYFYKNMHIILEKQEDGRRIQASVIQCRKLKTAKALYSLAKHYSAHVQIFRAEEYFI